jgi:hypothetical protein
MFFFLTKINVIINMYLKLEIMNGDDLCGFK